MRTPLRFVFGMGLVLSVGLVLDSPSSRAASPVGARPRPQLGVNLAGLVDWNTELPFVDVFRTSRRWISNQANGEQGFDLDEHGWVKRLDPGTFVTSYMCMGINGHYPSGLYTVLYKGKGRFDFRGGATIVESGPGRMVIRVDSASSGFYLRLFETDPSDYIRGIRVIMPGFEETYAREPFHPTFLARWKGVRCLRFMDWMETNGSEVSQWEERSKPDDATFSKQGAPLEWMIDLANRLQADPWFCMPHEADDEYVHEFATMVRDRLDPNLRAYVEYSNEVWNGGFPQRDYASQQGLKLGLSSDPSLAVWRYMARRSVEIFGIWEDVFGSTDRFVRVLPTQAVHLYGTEELLKFEDAYRHADVLAIAPYVGFGPRTGGNPSANDVANWSLSQLFQWLNVQELPKVIQTIRQQKAIADSRGLRLVAYEGGQHLVGGDMVAKNNEALTRLFVQANADPRMGLLYDRYLNAWEAVGGDLFCQFTSISLWGQYGSWGLLRANDEDPRLSPKFMAVFRWARRHGQPMSLILP